MIRRRKRRTPRSWTEFYGKRKKQNTRMLEKSSRDNMANALREKFCTVCGKKMKADFDPAAWDNLAERKKWHAWASRKKCADCQAAGRSVGLQKKYCVNCGKEFVRKDEKDKVWVAKVTCGPDCPAKQASP